MRTGDRGRDRTPQLRSPTLAAPGPCLWVGRGHGGAVTCVAVAPGGDRVLSGGADGSVRMWSRDGDAVAMAALHPGGVHDLAWISPALAVSVGEDRRAVFFDDSLAVLEAHALAGRPTHVACDRTSGIVALAIQGGWIGSLRRAQGAVVWSVEDTTTSLIAVGGAFARGQSDRWQCLAPDGALISSGSLDALSQGRFSGGHLRPHPDGRRVLAVVDGIEMELYTTRALSLLDPCTGTLEPRDAWSHSDLPTPWVGLDGEPLYFVTSTPRAVPPAATLAHPQAARIGALAVVDHELVVTGSIDGTVRGWDPRPRNRAPLAGQFIDGATRRAGELCTYEPERDEVRWWSAEDGGHLRDERIHRTRAHQVALTDDGSAVISSRLPGDAGGWAGLARGVGGSGPAWETEAPATCNGTLLAPGGVHGAAEFPTFRLREVWADTARLHDRATPHRAYGSATAVSESRVVSWDTSGVVCGWSIDSTLPIWERTLDGAAHAGIAVDGGAEVAILCAHRGTLWVTWLDVMTGAVRAQTARARGDLATTLVARSDSTVVSAGVVPMTFRRADAPGVAVPGVPRGYCTMLHDGGRFALHQAHRGARGVIDLDAGGLVPLGPDAAGDVRYQWTSLGHGPDGAPWLACSVTDGSVAVIDLAAARVLAFWPAHAGHLLAMGADAACARLLTAGTDGRVKVWSVPDGAPLGDWPGPRAAADLLAWNDDGAAVWGCDRDTPWVLRRYDPGQAVGAEEGAVTALAAPAVRPATAARWRLVGATSVVIHALADGREVARAITSVTGGLPGGALAPDGRYVFVSRFDDHELIDVAANQRRAVVVDRPRGRRATFLPGARLLLTGDDARVIDARDGATTLAVPLVDIGEHVERVAVAPDGDWIAVAAARDEGSARQWTLSVRSLGDGATVWRHDCDSVTALAVDGAGHVLVGHTTGEVRILAHDTGACVARWIGAEHAVDLVASSTGGLVLIDAAGQLRVIATVYTPRQPAARDDVTANR